MSNLVDNQIFILQISQFNNDVVDFILYIDNEFRYQAVSN